jgi:hypothetical protein
MTIRGCSFVVVMCKYSDGRLDSVVRWKKFVKKDADREVCMLSNGMKCCDVLP